MMKKFVISFTFISLIFCGVSLYGEKKTESESKIETQTEKTKPVKKEKKRRKSDPPPAAPNRTHSKGVIKDHKKAYDGYNSNPKAGEHINVKVTPPEKRGEKGKFLIEVYNHTKKNLSVLSFDIAIFNNEGVKLEAQIVVEDLVSGWSDIKKVTIPGGKMPGISGVNIDRVEMYMGVNQRVKNVPIIAEIIKE